MDEEKFKRMRQNLAEVAPEVHQAIPFYEDPTRYPIDKLVAMANMQHEMIFCDDKAPRQELLHRFIALRDSLTLLPNAPERIYLWPAGKMPTLTVYAPDMNAGYRYDHDPDFQPYLLEMLLPEEVTPVGAVVTIAGGQHGMGTLNECYQNGLEFNRLGYQCFILNSRPNRMPWNGKESGVDAARALRYIRFHAARYRLSSDRVAAAGFSNGGLNIDECIRYYSGDQTVADHFPGYEPDELDACYGAPDVFLCIYGARLHKVNDVFGMQFGPLEAYDYTRVSYPSTFFACGLEDETGLQNLYPVFNDLVGRGVKVEIHTFAGHPHGFSGWKLIDGKGFPNFDLWLVHADNFMQDVYKNYASRHNPDR